MLQKTYAESNPVEFFFDHVDESTSPEQAIKKLIFAIAQERMQHADRIERISNKIERLQQPHHSQNSARIQELAGKLNAAKSHAKVTATISAKLVTILNMIHAQGACVTSTQPMTETEIILSALGL